MPPKLTDADYADLAEFRFSIRQFLAFSESKAAGSGLTAQQHQALLVIRAADAGVATVGHLAERLILKPHSATGLVDRLVALDLVRRQPSARDKRQALLTLTKRADDILETLTATHREEVLRLRPMLIEMLENMRT
jgi:DNA-binding MarR family transcriptional regulator